MEKNSMKWKLSILISKGGQDDALVGCESQVRRAEAGD